MSKNTGPLVKNRAPAPIQISAEQLIREASDRQQQEAPAAATRIRDPEEHQSYLTDRRRHFEDDLRYRRDHIGTWVKYARFEEDAQEFVRARSVYERALEVAPSGAELWLRYAEFEMRNAMVNHARNVLDRAVQLLPRVDFLWYKYAWMEEMVGDPAKCRAVWERWSGWRPDDAAWSSYARFELRHGGDAHAVMRRYVAAYPCGRAFVRYAKFSEHEAKDVVTARSVYESGLRELDAELEPDGNLRLYRMFAAFEERHGEYERARSIYAHAVGLFGLGEGDDVAHDSDDGERKKQKELYAAYVAFENKHGGRAAVESALLRKHRASYETAVAAGPTDYDAWFEYASLEETHGTADAVREIYERAVAHVPPLHEKKHWRRYVYLWIKYALYEELAADDAERAGRVYDTALAVVPHASFTFVKLWVLAAKHRLRQRDAPGFRKLMGRCIGVTRGEKEKVFVEYAAAELAMGEVDRCRAVYGRYLECLPHSCRAWMRYADLERSVGEIERCRALHELAVSQPSLDMPELIWKSYIDFELSESDGDAARRLYSRLLERTGHVRVWISWAQFEGRPPLGGGRDAARDVFSRAYDALKDREDGGREDRVLLLDAWRLWEGEHGTPSGQAEVEAKMPRRVRRRRRTEDGEGWEEYFDYHFPDDGAAGSNLRILEMAAKWKQKMAEANDDDGSDDDDASDDDTDDGDGSDGDSE